MQFEIKVGLFDKITSIEKIADNAYRSVNKGSIYMTMSNYFCNDSYVTLFLTNREKHLLKAMGEVLPLSDNYNDLVLDISRALNTINTSWLAYLNSLLWVNKAIKKLKSMNPDIGTNPETWLGFDTSSSKISPNFSFVYLNPKFPPTVCLMIAPNVGLISLLDEKACEIILSLNKTELYHPIRIGSVIAPIPDPTGHLMSNNGAVRSLMVTELLSSWTGKPGVGNFHRSSIPSVSAYFSAINSGYELPLN